MELLNSLEKTYEHHVNNYIMLMAKEYGEQETTRISKYFSESWIFLTKFPYPLVPTLKESF